MELPEGSKAFFVGTKEFEDAFADEVWLRVGHDHFPVAGGENDWMLSDFGSARSNDSGMGDALVPLFSSRSQSSVTKPLMGEAVALAVETHEIPAEVQEAISAAYRAAKEG